MDIFNVLLEVFAFGYNNEGEEFTFYNFFIVGFAIKKIILLFTLVPQNKHGQINGITWSQVV
jgi:hypothetical protein